MRKARPAMPAQAGYALWCARSRRLFWSDAGARLHAWSPADGRVRSWRLPESPCCFALTASADRLLLGLAARLVLFDLASGALAPICALEAGAATRLTDGRCDRQGRFVFGTGADDPQAPGAFHRLNHDLSLERLPLDAAAFATGIGFSPDGRTMYYADASLGAIRRCDYHPCSGAITQPRTFVEAGAAPGRPGGAAVDAEGGLWSARPDTGQLLRFDRAGSIERVLDLAACGAGWPVFGGPDLGMLFLTAAQAGGASAAGQEGVLRVPAPGVHGLAEQRFLGRLPARA